MSFLRVDNYLNIDMRRKNLADLSQIYKANTYVEKSLKLYCIVSQYCWHVSIVSTFVVRSWNEISKLA